MIHEIIEGGLILIMELSYKHPWAVVAVQRLEQQPAGLEMGLNPAKGWAFIFSFSHNLLHENIILKLL